MIRHKEITLATEILELPGTATLDSIKSNYRRLLSKWHPDKCDKDQAICNEMTQ